MTTLKTAARETNHCDACALHEFHCLNYNKHQVKLSDSSIGSAPTSLPLLSADRFKLSGIQQIIKWNTHNCRPGLPIYVKQNRNMRVIFNRKEDCLSGNSNV